MADSRERIRGPSRDGRDGLTSPRQVLRRLMLLSEGRQYREAAGVVGRLGPSVLRSVVAELPLDILIDALPHSAYLLESFFSRLNTIVPSPKPEVAAESVVWHLVKLFGNPHEPGLRQSCTKLIHSLGAFQPDLRESLLKRRKSLDQAVRGLGVHGLTTDHQTKFISLHTAIKNELQRHIETYKMALHKLEELSPITHNSDPAQSSHQRLLAISYNDIQQRLIDNKTLLTILDKPSLRQLQQLIEKLDERVQKDKDVLFCCGQIKRIDPQLNLDSRPAAGLLMNFSRGCDSVLGLMGPVDFPVPSSPGGNSCCSDGYHSDSDAHDDEANTDMVLQYKLLYMKHRTDTMETMNELPQLHNANSLKTKILFSIIVLSFRACHALRDRKLLDVQRIMAITLPGIEPSPDYAKINSFPSLPSETNAAQNFDKAIKIYLKETADTFPLADMERQVAHQVLSTLHEYPCLETCIPLFHYISACCRLAWKMANHTCPYYLDHDFTLGQLCLEKHERHPSSNHRSDSIRGFLWPALIQNGRCVFKAVVAT